MSTKPIMVKGKMVGFIKTYVPEGWGTPEFDAKFPPVMGESYLQRIRREYDSEDRAMAAESLLPKSPVQAVYLLYREISDQMGTSEVVGVYSDSSRAEMEGAAIKDRRTFIKPMALDSVSKK